jgi:hypothetical protein
VLHPAATLFLSILLAAPVHHNGPQAGIHTNIQRYMNLNIVHAEHTVYVAELVDPAKQPGIVMADSGSNLTVNPVARILTDLARQSKHITSFEVYTMHISSL